jgi:dimethylaniline monooxygenase (N-oxide forming)
MANTGTAEHPLDLLIVGAGIYGICAASTYLQLHETHDIVVLDSDQDVGGVWSKQRHYPLFWSQSGVSVAGFPDKAFDPPAEAERYHGLVEAKWLGKYLEDYVSDQVYDGRSLRERFSFRATVLDVSRAGGDGRDLGAWRVEADREGTRVVYWSQKIIIASGLSSLPNMPELPGKDTFIGTIVHQKDIGESLLLTDSEPNIDDQETITIYGGSKSAADLAYAAVKDRSRYGQRRKVNWIIRKTGTGPLAFVHPKSPVSGYDNLAELGSIRMMAGLSCANPWLPANTWREWFFNTPLGEWVQNKIWSRTEQDSIAMADFEGRKDKLQGFEGLRASGNVRWRSGPLGILQREDFWDEVAQGVRIVRGDIVKLEDDELVLEDGRRVRTDVLICATGWKQEFPFFRPAEAARLGVPLSLKEEVLVEKEKAYWEFMDSSAERAVVARWPYLRQVPRFRKTVFNTTSYRLYRHSLPVQDDTIAFLGIPLVPNSYHTSLVQTLFAIAALDGKLKLPSEHDMEKDIAYINAWNRFRYPVHGALGNVVEFEQTSFTDSLLEQLGLRSHRLSEQERKTWRGWWQDLTRPTYASDYAGLLDEYRRKYISQPDDTIDCKEY